MAALTQRGIKVTLVTSGAVGAGMGKTGMAKRPRSLPVLQAAAAIGQPTLMSMYEQEFARHELLVGQVLVTRKDFEQRSRYVNISNTIEALHRLKAVPIINENDTVAVDELDRFADNDTIAALMTNLLRADLLVLLTVVDGLLDADGQLVDLVPAVSDDVKSLARTERSALGSGGMHSKLGAARLVTEAGEGVVIANGRHPDVLLKLLDGERVGTIFAPAAQQDVGPAALDRRGRPAGRARWSSTPERSTRCTHRARACWPAASRASRARSIAAGHRPDRRSRRPDHRPRHHQLQRRRTQHHQGAQVLRDRRRPGLQALRRGDSPRQPRPHRQVGHDPSRCLRCYSSSCR